MPDTQAAPISTSNNVRFSLRDRLREGARKPLRQLVGYQRVTLVAGETVSVTFEVHADLFSYTDERYRRVVEPGDVEPQVGVSSKDLTGGLVLLVGEERGVGPTGCCAR